MFVIHNMVQRLCVLLILGLLCGRQCDGQTITATLDPESFLPSVTSQVSVTCAVTSSPSSPTGAKVLLLQLGKLPSENDEDGGEGTDEGGGEEEEEGEVLIATATAGAEPTLNDESDKDRMAVDGNISNSLSTLTLTLTSLVAKDAGIYVCRASLLNAAYHVQELTASANLTIIDKEDTAPLILAKEQILESEHQQMEKDASSIHEELQAAISKQRELEDQIRHLESKNDNLTQLVEGLISEMADLKSLVPSGHGGVGNAAQSSDSSLHDADDIHMLRNDLDDVKAKLEQLVHEQWPALSSRLNTVEESTLPLIQNALNTVQNKLASLEMEEELKETNIDSHADNQHSAEDAQREEEEEELQSMKTRLEQLEGRLDVLEGGTVNVLANKVYNVSLELAEQSEMMEKMSGKCEELEARLTLVEADDILSHHSMSNTSFDNEVEVLSYSFQDFGESVDDDDDEVESSDGDDDNEGGNSSSETPSEVDKDDFGNNNSDDNDDKVDVENYQDGNGKSFYADEDETQDNDNSYVGYLTHAVTEGDEEEQFEGGRQCYVCGDVDKSHPCTIDDLRTAHKESCPPGLEFCMNDIVQEQNKREIYKRCVSHDECVTKHSAEADGDCAAFSFMSHGQFTCHFCCTSDNCNLDFKPSLDLFKG